MARPRANPNIGIVTYAHDIGSKETAMSTTIFERIALAQLLVGGCAVAVGLIEHSQAQPVNIPHAPPPPVVNPSSLNTVQPSYTSLANCSR
jgi:hypothetical protein